MKKKRNYGGREPLDEEDRKSEVLKVRLTKGEIEHLKRLHDKSYYKNFSDLVRKLLYKEAIEVDVRNIDLDKLISVIQTINKSCDKFLRSQKKEVIDYKAEMEEIKIQLNAIKETICSFEKAELYLIDLRDISESEKIDKHYLRRFYYK